MDIDTIADITTSIRNADMYRKGVVRVASTNISQSIVKILLQEGFIENVRKHRENNKYFLVLTLRHSRNRKRTYQNLLNLKRISQPGLRIYSNYQRIPRILGGMGIVILSTSRGIMTNREPRLERIGREIWCLVLYMVIFLISELNMKLLFCEKEKRGGGLSNRVLTPPVDTSRGFTWNERTKMDS